MAVMNSLKSLVQMALEFMLIVIIPNFDVVQNQSEIRMEINGRLQVTRGWVLEV
jgi:hypothetical protein